jgi:hypothetical protein
LAAVKGVAGGMLEMVLYFGEVKLWVGHETIEVFHDHPLGNHRKLLQRHRLIERDTPIEALIEARALSGMLHQRVEPPGLMRGKLLP